ncbi:MAG: phosphate-starvation-inducible PsiE family protein [Dehalococcoidia bacterium]
MQHRKARMSSDPHELTAPWLDWADQAVYVLVALLFLVSAVAMGGYAVITFGQHLRQDFPLQLIRFVNDLLLVLIIMEVAGTVRSYLTSGTTSLRPFLYIGIISATRRILAIGAQSALTESVSETQFRHMMIDLGMNGAVVLALAAALFLFSRHQREDAENAGTPASQGTAGRGAEADSPRPDRGATA